MSEKPEPAEFLIELDQADEATLNEALAEAGGRIVLQLDSGPVAVSVDLPQEKLQELLPPGARIMPAGSEGARAPAARATEPVGLRAFRLRQSPEFRAAKLRRPHPGKEWGTEGLEEPDVHDDEPDQSSTIGVERSAARALEAPSNERMVNRTAVGIVVVKGPGDLAISQAEIDNIVAEAQEGLTMLSGFEPNAKASWIFDDEVMEATVPAKAWDGARWPGMPLDFYKGPDAALMREDNGRIYFFKGTKYVRYSNVSAGVDEGYPREISAGWKGMPASFNSGIDAALWRMSNGKIYFFKGNQYVRFSDVDAGMDAGYPKPIASNWPGMPAEFNDGIDAALLRKDNGKIYFFKGDQYVRFSNVSDGVDAGYPKPIAGNWKGLPDWYTNGITAALWRNSNGKIYLFKWNRMVGTYVRFSKVDDGVDEGYENGVPIGLSKEEAESLWRDPALTSLGFPVGIDGVTALVNDLKNRLNTQWVYCGFFTKHATVWFAYAGSCRVVMRKDSFAVGDTGNMDRVFAHETGHIFGAPDEYASSNCACGASKGKFFTEPNDNCATCNPDLDVACVMRSNSNGVCPSTPWHFGWGAFLTKVDAAVWRGDNDKAYLFSNTRYIRFTDIGAGRDEGYPKKISGNWPGLPNNFKNGIDAALWREDNGKLYLFKGSEYVRFSNVSDGVDAGYPKPVAGNWKGMPAAFNEGIDAALWRESNGKIYFFKGGQYLRISSVDAGMDAGYPKPIAGNWNGMPTSFNNGIDAALMRKDNHKLYFFKGTRYVRLTDVGATMDAGYPNFINGNWIPFPT